MKIETGLVCKARAGDVERTRLAADALPGAFDEAMRARQVADRLMSTSLPRRWAHVQSVARVAELLAEANSECADAVPAAWLHDIGYVPLVAAAGFHPLAGARHARQLGFSETVVGLVAFHTCSRIEARRRGHLPLLESEFTDFPSPARDALWAADATTGPDGRRPSLTARLDDIEDRYGPNHLVARCSGVIVPRLELAIARARRLAPAAFPL